MLSPPLELFGETISGEEFDKTAKKIDQFFAEHASKIREVIEDAGHFGGCSAFDYAIIGCRSSSTNDEQKAELAWQAIAWEHLIAPYGHEKRKFYQDQHILAQAVIKAADAYYKYAVFVLKKPDEETYLRIRRLNARVGALYLEYCKNVTVALQSGKVQQLSDMWGV
jgi:hypothetical protein